MIKSAVGVTVSMFLFLMLSGYGLAGDYQLPDTGIDKCYENYGEITCPSPGQPFYGQDAQYDGPQPSYQDNGNGTVTDVNTNLMWQQGDDGTTGNWQQALDYCEALTLPSGGYSDWRLPNRRELMSIVDYGRRSPSINTVYFPNCRPSNYWSSSTYADYSNDAWYFNFYHGGVASYPKTLNHYVRCVRGGPTPVPSFNDNGNGTVSDSVTDLMWQQSDDGATHTWGGALDYCEGLSLGGHSDWRLPNVRELESIGDWDRFNPAIDTTYFPGCRSSGYWSGSTDTSGSDDAWYVSFSYGYVIDSDKTNGETVRCVRGGPGGSIETPTVTTTAVSSITSTTASSGGNVTSSGGASVTVRGVCWSTSANPTTSDSKTTDGTGTGSFTSSITGLSANTTYHVRAYATNSVGTNYGSDVSFTTSAAAPTVTTGTATSVTSTSATLNGTVNPNGAETTYYFEYGTTTSYGSTTTSTSAGSGTSDVSVNAAITGLTTGTTYHYRLLATNSAGTSYGTDQTLTTSVLRPDLSIGSGSGARGRKVALPIILDNVDGTDIAAVSVDVGYDTEVFGNLKATLGPAGSAVDKTVATSEPWSGVFRVTVFSASNNTPIGDGVVAYLELTVASDASYGETTLTSSPSASDPLGSEVAIEGSDGTVNIIVYFAGDCNDDGTVSVAEVQAAINMYLDIIPVEDCVDVNGNGKVSIGEIQKVVNNHLNIGGMAALKSLGGAVNITPPGIRIRQIEIASSTSIPSLDIGQTTGALGATVTVPLTLTNASGYEVSALSTDITYDTSLLENPSAEIGPAGTDADKAVIFSEVSSGTIRVGVFSASNNNIIGNGVVAYVSFRIKLDASLGQTTLGNTPSGSDPLGNDVPMEGADGTITISQTTVSAQITSLWPIDNAQCGQTSRLWAEVKNNGSSALPSNATVWFYVDGPSWSGTNWVGSASVSGLSAGSTDWYLFDWSIPSGATLGTYTYWAQVYTDSTAISDWSSGQEFSVSCGSYSGQVLQLWPVDNATCDQTSTLWAEVKNTGSSVLPSNATVWYWVTGPSWSGTNWVGSASVSGLSAGSTEWYLFDWPIPSGATAGTYTYWAQVWTDTAISDWSSAQTFDVSCGGIPGPTTLISPSGTITDSTPTYSWNSVSGSTWYYLWVDNSTGNKINQWYTAEQAGCASGGTCSGTPDTALADGPGQWWVQTWNSNGYGPWSDPLSFTLQ